jgi:outer membrane protein assembly factor BamB
VATNGIMYGFDAAHSRFNPYERILSPVTVPHLELAWTAQTSSKIPSSPAVANGVVYVGSQDFYLYAFKAAGCGEQAICQPLWTAQTSNYINSSPAVANGVVYIGSTDGRLYAFKAAGKPSVSPCGLLRRVITSTLRLLWPMAWSTSAPPMVSYTPSQPLAAAGRPSVSPCGLLKLVVPSTPRLP